jgi:hypothetical protein
VVCVSGGSALDNPPAFGLQYELPSKLDSLLPFSRGLSTSTTAILGLSRDFSESYLYPPQAYYNIDDNSMLAPVEQLTDAWLSF